MRSRDRLLCLIALSLATCASAAKADEMENVRLAAARLSDMEATAETRDVNAKEFTRLKKSAQALQFKRIQFYYKAPDKFRVDSRVRELLRVSMVQDGDRETFRTSFGLRRTRDLSDDPARKQDTLDFGVLSAPLWRDYRIRATGEESFEAIPCLLLEMTLIRDPGHGHYKVWLDKKTFRVVSWERFTADGQLKVRYVFREPDRSVSGVWYSRRIELHSPEGHFVGALALSDVRINQGLGDDLFR